MDANKLTLRSQAALDGARQQAVARSHQAIEPQREIQDPLAVKLLSGEIGEGDTVLVDADDGSLTIGVVPTHDPVLAEPD
jgi:ATP-dependent Clp protease ATP-binding subunit ClpA